ncbi:MAG: hypothetical protein QGI46_04035 [Planctomycetota bacterium]|jgi:hypothetical protein|nr:hypothetical protein [Planctomycetota bacterium]
MTVPALSPSALLSGPETLDPWGACVRIDLGQPDSTLAISRENRLPRASVVVTMAARELMRLSKGGDKLKSILVIGSEVDPTQHPAFKEITENLRELRNKWFPRAKLCLISNDPDLERVEVRLAIGAYDRPMIRFEAGTARTFARLTGHKSTRFRQLAGHLESLDRVSIQACFVRGTVDNSTDSEIEGWLRRLQEVEPKEVLISSPNPRKRGKDLPWGIPIGRLKGIVEQIGDRIGAEVTVVDAENS